MEEAFDPFGELAGGAAGWAPAQQKRPAAGPAAARGAPAGGASEAQPVAAAAQDEDEIRKARREWLIRAAGWDPAELPEAAGGASEAQPVAAAAQDDDKEARREELLRLARKGRDEFAALAPENDDWGAEPLAPAGFPDEVPAARDASADAGRGELAEAAASGAGRAPGGGEVGRLPDGFAFPVTQKIMTFLKRFSAPGSYSADSDDGSPQLVPQLGARELIEGEEGAGVPSLTQQPPLPLPSAALNSPTLLARVDSSHSVSSSVSSGSRRASLTQPPTPPLSASSPDSPAPAASQSSWPTASLFSLVSGGAAAWQQQHVPPPPEPVAVSWAMPSTASSQTSSASTAGSTSAPAAGGEGTAASAAAQPKLSAYSRLISTLRHPRATDVLGSIKSFVGRFLAEHASAVEFTVAEEGEPESAEDAAATAWDGDFMPGQNNAAAAKVQAFLRKLEAQVRVHPLWRGCSDAEWLDTEEGLEKFLMVKLERCAFQPMARDRRADARLQRKIAELSFLRAEHLEVASFSALAAAPPSPAIAALEDRWVQAGVELQNMSRFRAPRDKMVCVLNCCRLISNVLREATPTAEAAPGGGQDPAAARLSVGADEFVPALIFVVLKANPAALHSNLDYIAAYRNPARLRAEPGYFFTQLAMAVSFIQALDAKTLNISEHEFNSGVLLCRQRIAADPTFSFGWRGRPRTDKDASEPAIAHTAVGAGVPLSPKASSPRAAARRALPPVDANALQEWRDARFRFAARSAASLRLGEMHELLDEYKALVRAVEAMLGERSVTTPAILFNRPT